MISVNALRTGVDEMQKSWQHVPTSTSKHISGIRNWRIMVQRSVFGSYAVSLQVST